jgi:photosystem II stability/assembly factor-like uncharacterized protein
MKTAIFLLALFTGTAVLQAQPWQEQVSGVSTQLTSVSAIDFTNAWICGYSGVVLRTTNAGINWLNVSGGGIPATIQLINVFGINPTTALVAGYIGSNTWVYRTTNAGVNWTQVFTQTGGFINAVWVRLDGTGFMMGDPVGARWSLWKTTDNGVNWDSSGLYLPQSGTEAGYNNCMAIGLDRIWFGTNNTRIYHSSNFGTNWTVQPSTPEVSIFSIWFDPNGAATGYCGGGTNVLKTTNYGTNWASIGSLGTGAIGGITGLPMWSGNVWYVKNGNNNIYFGFGQNQWFIQHTASAGTYRHIAAERIPNFPFDLYAVRTNGGISHTTFFVEGVKSIEGEVPGTYSLFQNYPNPFNPVTKIRFDIRPYKGGQGDVSPLEGGQRRVMVRLAIYDILGREVAILVNQHLQPGTYEVNWSATGGASDFTSGVYFYKLTVSDYTETKKMILIK